MKILSCVSKGYYGSREAIDPLFIAFTDTLRSMGHEVDHFDHRLSNWHIGPLRTGERFLELVRGNGYDAVLYQTALQMPEAIAEPVREAGRYVPTIAWNSDDDWRWDAKTSRMAEYFTFVFTTVPHVYQQNRASFPNLRLSQWGCLDGYGDFDRPKDLDFTFVGQVYPDRIRWTRALARRAGLRVYGYKSGTVNLPGFLWWPGIRNLTSRISAIYGRPIPFEQLHEVWNRSRISFTPMEAVDPNVLQIKGRTFEQGLSGTLMMCRQSPNLELYYEPGKELVSFEDLDDCVSKVKFYLTHESERARIARAYRDRTRGEHMWTHRFEKMFRDIGLA